MSTSVLPARYPIPVLSSRSTVPIDGAPLLFLLTASKPELIGVILTDAFRGRFEGVDARKREKIQTQLQITPEQTNQLLTSLTDLIHLFLYHGADTKESFFALLPSDFHSSLRGLLARLMMGKLAEWRDEMLNQCIGPAKLVEFDWRVDLKTSSSHLSHLSVPTVIVDLQLQPAPTSTNIVAPMEAVQFELSPQALNTLLTGLEKIQGQLREMK